MFIECTPSEITTIERPQTRSDLVVNSVLEAVDSTLPKLEVIDVNLRVIEAKELKFDIDF